MYEVEYKVQADHRAVRKRLSELGGVQIGTRWQHDTYYNAPDRDFAETDEALRVREEWATKPATDQPALDQNGTHTRTSSSQSDTSTGETTHSSVPWTLEPPPENVDLQRTLLTYKGPLVDERAKIRTEAETQVANSDAIGALLDGLGYTAVSTVEKRRELYRLEDCLVTLDDVAGLDQFVEVEFEGDVPAESRTAAQDRVRDQLEALALDPDETVQTSYLGMVLAEE